MQDRLVFTLPDGRTAVVDRDAARAVAERLTPFEPVPAARIVDALRRPAALGARVEFLPHELDAVLAAAPDAIWQPAET